MNVHSIVDGIHRDGSNNITNKGNLNLNTKDDLKNPKNSYIRKDDTTHTKYLTINKNTKNVFFTRCGIGSYGVPDDVLDTDEENIIETPNPNVWNSLFSRFY